MAQTRGVCKQEVYIKQINKHFEQETLERLNIGCCADATAAAAQQAGRPGTPAPVLMFISMDTKFQLKLAVDMNSGYYVHFVRLLKANLDITTSYQTKPSYKPTKKGSCSIDSD